MPDYQEFRRNVQKRRRRKKLRIAVALLALVLACAGVGWVVLDGFGLFKAGPAAASSVPESTASSAASATSAPGQDALPEEVFTLAANADAAWNTSAYGVRVLNTDVQGQDDGTTAMDFRLAALPACGVVDPSFFDNATFVGDSLTQGLQIYSEGLPNAHYCAYKGIGPNAIVNGVTVKDIHGNKQIPMDALAASQPNVVYVLLGTNVLTGNSSYDSFLAYYDQLIDMIQATIPGIPIYIQSITPVRPEVKDTPRTAGLNTARLRAINDEVAAMALRKGCYFVDLWEVLADDNGDLIADYAQPDGIHLKTNGYAAWVMYLREHTKYMPGATYEAGTSYYIEN